MENKTHHQVVASCQNCKKDFVIEEDDFSFYEKIKVPPPTFCYLCRAQRRFAFRNERKLFKTESAFSGKSIFSLYPKEANRRVVTQEEWFGDTWDATSFGTEFDVSKTFLSQILELEKSVPIYNLNTQLMVNSPYSGNATALKNCYLVFNANYSENCMCGNAVDKCKDCVDNSHINNSERCYECFWLQNCYRCYFTITSTECSDVWFSRDCVSCTDCIGCVNLRNASHCIFNQQYSKEDYDKEVEKMMLNTHEGIEATKEKSKIFWQTQPLKFNQGIKNLNSSGAYVTNCKNTKDSYLMVENEDMKYCQYMQVPGNKDCYDCCVWGQKTQFSYETSVCGENSYNLKFCFNCWPNCKDSEYSMNLYNSSDCFGCVGLKNKKYCILNKQYSKEDYEELVLKIKHHMDEIPYKDKQGFIYKYGEFFPIEFSPFGYNNTIATQHFPLFKEESKEKGYAWIEAEQGFYEKSIKATDLPNAIQEVGETILKEVIECASCQKAYRILENELIFLKKENLPLPRMCNDCRFDVRIKNRMKVFLYDRFCMCSGEFDSQNKYKNSANHVHKNTPCDQVFKTGFEPGSENIVYCEKCYQQEVY